MGTYLSTPVTDKCSEHGESLDVTKTNVVCRWGVVDQQGWRKSMEDAHVAVTDLPLKGDDGGDGAGDDPAQPPLETEPVDAKVFGVFDGHGGAEVARFCQLYLVSVLKQQPTWKENVTGLPTTPDDPSIPTDPDDLDAAGQTAVGMALRSTFHALDRMIDDPERRQEIMQLRSMKPQLGERREATSIPSPKDISHIVPPPFYLIRPSASTTAAAATGAGSEGGEEEGTENSGNHDDGIIGDESINTQENPEATSPAVIEIDENDTDQQQKEDSTETSGSQEVDSATNNDVDIVHKEDDNDDGEESATDDDSERAVGLEEAAEQDRDMMLDSSSDDGDVDDVSTGAVPVDDLDIATSSNGGETKTEKLNTMFQKILAMGTARGQVVVSDESTEDDSSEANKANTNVNAQQNAASLTPPHADTTGGPNARVPTVTHSGRLICNLPDHAVHAGATAIVAVMTGQVLTVANAGDSRAVMCRAGGETFPLSFDHKPSQEVEMTRIRHAGGFVNHFGRINGNLNLSRSIGDLKYKQVPGIPPADQMITAEPDIKQVALKADDEFIILGCDGIWDCLTNEAAVEFVRQRIDTMLPVEIGTEMLDQIISEDPRVTQGIGGDNQTVMIIDLQPTTRSCHGKDKDQEEASTDETEVSSQSKVEPEPQSNL